MAANQTWPRLGSYFTFFLSVSCQVKFTKVFCERKSVKSFTLFELIMSVYRASF